MTQSDYDSGPDTLKHIFRVQELIYRACNILHERATEHDTSKLYPPEKELYDKLTPLLSGSEYNSPEYMEFLKKLKPALDHHYANNSHHPEHYPDGVAGMNLFDLIEMFLDWKAASERHETGNIYVSIEKNTDRFNLDPQIVSIFKNTAKFMEWEK